MLTETRKICQGFLKNVISWTSYEASFFKISFTCFHHEGVYRRRKRPKSQGSLKKSSLKFFIKNNQSVRDQCSREKSRIFGLKCPLFDTLLHRLFGSVPVNSVNAYPAGDEGYSAYELMQPVAR